MQNFLRRTTNDILTNMRFHTYIYGRTLKIDFREICSPQGGLSDKSVSLIQQLINTDVISNGDIDRLRYLFVRERHQVLFGVGFNHRQYLDKIHWTDLTKKRGLRSFVGIVIDNEEFCRLTSIPVDSSFFINLYMKCITNVWELEDRPKNRQIIISESSVIDSSDDWYQLDGKIRFNTDENLCHFFARTDEISILRSLKNCSSSVAIGLNVESHVISAFRKFKVNIPNAVCLDTQVEHDFKLVTANYEQKESMHKRKKADGSLQSSPKILLNDRKGTNTTETVVTGSVSEPAILSCLKRTESLSDNSANKELLQEGNLMNIDWGDDNLTESPIISINTQNEGDSEISLKANNDESTTLSEDMVPISFDINRDDTDDKSKKEYRPKIVILIGMIAMILIVIAMCSKEIQTSKHTTSGEKTLRQNPNFSTLVSDSILIKQE